MAKARPIPYEGDDYRKVVQSTLAPSSSYGTRGVVGSGPLSRDLGAGGTPVHRGVKGDPLKAFEKLIERSTPVGGLAGSPSHQEAKRALPRGLAVRRMPVTDRGVRPNALPTLGPASKTDVSPAEVRSARALARGTLSDVRGSTSWSQVVDDFPDIADKADFSPDIAGTSRGEFEARRSSKKPKGFIDLPPGRGFKKLDSRQVHNALLGKIRKSGGDLVPLQDAAMEALSGKWDISQTLDDYGRPRAEFRKLWDAYANRAGARYAHWFVQKKPSGSSPKTQEFFEQGAREAKGAWSRMAAGLSDREHERLTNLMMKIKGTMDLGLSVGVEEGRKGTVISRSVKDGRWLHSTQRATEALGVMTNGVDEGGRALSAREKLRRAEKLMAEAEAMQPYRLKGLTERVARGREALPGAPKSLWYKALMGGKKKTLSPANLNPLHAGAPDLTEGARSWMGAAHPVAMGLDTGQDFFRTREILASSANAQTKNSLLRGRIGWKAMGIGEVGGPSGSNPLGRAWVGGPTGSWRDEYELADGRPGYGITIPDQQAERELAMAMSSKGKFGATSEAERKARMTAAMLGKELPPTRAQELMRWYGRSGLLRADRIINKANFKGVNDLMFAARKADEEMQVLVKRMLFLNPGLTKEMQEKARYTAQINQQSRVTGNVLKAFYPDAPETVLAKLGGVHPEVKKSVHTTQAGRAYQSTVQETVFAKMGGAQQVVKDHVRSVLRDPTGYSLQQKMAVRDYVRVGKQGELLKELEKLYFRGGGSWVTRRKELEKSPRVMRWLISLMRAI